MDYFAKYSPSDKKKVTKDWHELFQSLTIYKPMQIFNRLGPLVVGITLQTSSGNHAYNPMYHVHCLCRIFPAIIVTLHVSGLSMYPAEHDAKYKEIAASISDKFYIPIEGNVHINDVVMAYERYFQNPDLSTYTEYEDLVLICGWCGDEKRTDYALQVVRRELSKWPEERYFSHIGGFEKWFADLAAKAKDTDTLRKICEQQIIELKLGKLPVRELIC